MLFFCRNTNSNRFQSARSTDFDTKNFSCDLNITLGFTPEFSPLKSPHVPPDVNEENVFGENTPTPPRCKTPPKGMLLNWSETKMIMILRRFGLSQHIPIFLEQEVSIISVSGCIKFVGKRISGNIVSCKIIPNSSELII